MFNMQIYIRRMLAWCLLTYCCFANADSFVMQMKPGALVPNTDHIGIYVKEIPKPEMKFDGGCLLCKAAAAASHLELSRYLDTLPANELVNLKNDIAEVLRKKSVDASVITEVINVDELPDASEKGRQLPKKNFTSLKSKFNINKLVVIEVDSMGFIRQYSGYLPKGPPKAFLFGRGYLVNLDTNTYEWYWPIKSYQSTEDKNWDEPPKYPSLTNTYFTLLETVRQRFSNTFINEE
jgi:hypothetical protein